MKSQELRQESLEGTWHCVVCVIPDGMEAYLKVDSCPEEPQLRMKNIEEDDYYEDPYDSDMDIVRLDDNYSPPVLQIRSVAKKHPKTWVHYIAAEEDDWEYAPSGPTSSDT